MKVTEKDLIGDIKDFPIEVVQRMVECQVEQGNEADVAVFQEKNHQGRESKGFTWSLTSEDYDFWNSVIRKLHFDLFFQRYPKPKPYPKVMLVWDEGQTIEDAFKRVVFMEKCGRFLTWLHSKSIEESEEQINVETFDFAQDIPELPEKVTIKEKGIEVEGVDLSIEQLETILNELKNK